MATYAVDFETFYSNEYTIKDMGVTAYVNDPRFDAYMVAIVGDDGLEWCGDPKLAPWEKLSGHTWISHNAAFDEQVFDRLVRDGHIKAGIAPTDWWCTSCMAVYLQAPRSLAGAVKQLLGEHVDKSQRTAQQGRRATTEELNNDPALREYTLNDSRKCLELWVKFSDQWPHNERRLGRLTYLLGVAGIRIDVEGATRDLDSLVAQREEARNLVPWKDEAPVLSPIRLRRFCTENGMWAPDSFAQTDSEAQRWEDEYSEQHAWVKGLRNFRRTNMLATKYQTLLTRTANGTFSYAMKYAGASPTFRWSGDAGLNVQNLPKGELFGCDLRKRFVASPGNTFVVCDLAQIEVRTLAYLAGNDGYLNKIFGGLNPYEAAAELLLTKAQLGPEGGKGLKKRSKTLYATIKAQVLGCGYGMGGNRFQEAAPALTGGEYNPTAKEAEAAVNNYREANPEVVKLWGAMQRGMKASVGDQFDVDLPSGRSLRYFNVSRIGDKFTAKTELGGKSDFFFGGKLVENASQGFARDVFAEALLRVHDAGIGRIVFHVHDELVVEVPKASAEEFAEEIRRLMCVTPEWCPGLPVDAEWALSEVYCK